MEVFPALSSPRTRILTSLFPKYWLKSFEMIMPIKIKQSLLDPGITLSTRSFSFYVVWTNNTEQCRGNKKPIQSNDSGFYKDDSYSLRALANRSAKGTVLFSIVSPWLGGQTLICTPTIEWNLKSSTINFIQYTLNAYLSKLYTKTPTIVKMRSHILFIEASTICTHHSGNLVIEPASSEKTWVGDISRTYSTMTKGTAVKVFLHQTDSCLELERKREM